MPTAEWSGKRFSMSPHHPTVGENPCTRCLNMIMGQDGALHRRKGFDGGAAGAPQNHIVAQMGGINYLFIKTAAGVQYTTGGGFSGIAAAGLDQPINGGITSATEKGSFATYGEEVYYCDTNTILSWNGTGGARRPGVIGLQGLVYNGGSGNTDPPLPGGPFGKTDPYYTAIPSHNPTVAGGMDPGITQDLGEKTLNTAFAFSYYDPIRKIYGRRNVTMAYPYVFGPPDPDGSNSVLSDQRGQFAKFVHTPGPNAAHPEYKVAVWFSLGQNILTNVQATVINFPFFYFNEFIPAMSKRMTNTLFLETIAATNVTALKCVKDNATLYQSGRYIDAYERPVPAKYMVILANGTAAYFFPWLSTPENGGSAAALGNHAIYSVNHPEQIGLDTFTQRDTISPLPNLKGVPVATVSDGNVQLLLTSLAAYSVGFDGNVILHEIFGGRGVRSRNSPTHSGVGVFWYADEGVVWLRGGQISLLDSKIGFADWFSDLNPTQKAAVIVGPADSAQQVLMFCADLEHGGQHALCYDYGKDFVSEFTGFGTVTYAAYFQSNTSSKLWAFGAGLYPSESIDGSATEVVLWVNDGVDRPKTLKSVILDVGPHAGSISVAVTSHQAGDDNEGAPEYDDARTDTITSPGSGAGRFDCPNMLGMRGRMFKIVITGPSGAWSLQKVRAEYEFGVDDDSRSL